MTITPDEANKITGLKVRGGSVDADYYDMSLEELYKLFNECFGWDDYKTELEFCRSVKDWPRRDNFGGGIGHYITNLKKEFGNTSEKVEKGELVMDEIKVKQTGTTYLLYTLGRDIFLNLTGNKVNANYLILVKDLATVNKYAWGTTALAYLLEQLATASRLASTYIGGNFTMLKVWVYDHFSILELAKKLEKYVNWVDTLLTAARYKFEDEMKRNNEQLVTRLREKLNSLNLHDVDFDPYSPKTWKKKMKLFKIKR
ncbi:protein MAINTENANCE OF MERISTEMS-like [Papaver somniferum]|uniref:protein MAINTENANCE OF MERISTEMS-like n=1 Tax=Papaver somniferum TaxID=3469 RepID=UPI000E70593F|nr:protein MAINTENANCE OF MERISTEMS-like [Papaver somniferum]